jgi:hypothetical protein
MCDSDDETQCPSSEIQCRHENESMRKVVLFANVNGDCDSSGFDINRTNFGILIGGRGV